MQRLLPPVLVAILMVAMTASLLLTSSTFPWFLRALGLPVLAAGGLLTIRHATLFRHVGTNIRTFDDPGSFIRTGGFSFTRNPMYLGFLLLLIGFAVALGSVAAMLGPIAFFAAAHWWYIPFEEQRMAALFPDEYADYRQQVRRWIGRYA